MVVPGGIEFTFTTNSLQFTFMIYGAMAMSFSPVYAVIIDEVKW